jgi:hypothetical protein
MKKFNDLIQTVHELKNTPTFKSDNLRKRITGDKPFLSEQLEYQVAHGFIQNYDEMAGIMYPQKKSVGSALYRLTHHVKEKALSSLFAEDLSSGFRNELDRRRYLVQRNYVLAELMILKGHTNPGWDLLRKTAFDAARYSLSYFSFMISEKLCYYHVLKGKNKNFQNAMQHTATLARLCTAETEAEQLFYELSLLMNNRWHFEKRIKTKARLAFKRTKELIRTFHSHSMWLYFFRIAIYYYYTIEDYRGMLKITRKFRHYLLRNPHLQQDARMAELTHHEMNACMMLRNFVYGIRSAEENQKFLHANNRNWMLYMENYFQLLMHSGKYTKAQKVYAQVTRSRYWKGRTTAQRELWKINNAYLHFALNDINEISLFMPARFLNEIITLRKDKEGLNFVIQVAEMIYLLAHNDQDRLASFGESFRVYVSRHISKKKHYRSYYFSKLLLLLYKYNFDAKKAERIGEKFYNRLLSFNTRPQQDRKMIELIPYDQLWHMILRAMKEASIRSASSAF